ncbi:MAG TPA: Rieske 2Fe-2S domain-containing protein, partial [Actinomycetota bacterium]|nr:Rieske 2Fe-2S domain-containing protein [Actinomycetota bacterium]
MKAERVVSTFFALSMLASMGLVVTYVAGGDPQVEGALLAVALGGLGIGVSVWALELLPSDTAVEEREPLTSPEETVEGAEAVVEDERVTRRTVLVRLLAGAGTTLVAALAIPALSLGPRPGQSLFRTTWVAGKRVVDEDGNPIRPADIPLQSVHTVFPEGDVGSPDAQTVLVKVQEDLLELSEERAAWAPEGCIGYSKICTHAGCPVGLYRSESHELLCPCHQSTFDVLRGCEVTFGPADRPLPQL